MTQEGVVNCFVTDAKYLQIVFDDEFATFLWLAELLIFSQYDQAQYGTVTTNGDYIIDRPLGPLVPGLVEDYTEIDNFSSSIGELVISISETVN